MTVKVKLHVSTMRRRRCTATPPVKRLEMCMSGSAGGGVALVFLVVIEFVHMDETHFKKNEFRVQR